MPTLRTLVVDDSAVFLRQLCLFLKDHELVEVAGTAQSGEQALGLAESVRPDLVLLDLRLPGLSGAEAARRLRALLPDAILILMSTRNDEGTREAALAQGADGFVSKFEVNARLMPEIERLRAARARPPAAP